ncbi:hypothetical protein [Rhizobium laguerreae]|uniref:hypothetical protein n=1 Tax=Rhizobium laguerreae TaxID=1076926 RepID=UPI0019FB3BDC|nr:hypothetical protein [Rhizobium laguerreae]NKM28649.1 hypothetical protein [Rhizobium laguerreae]
MEERVEDCLYRVESLLPQDLTLRLAVRGDGDVFKLDSRSIFRRNDGLRLVGSVVENELHHLRKMDLLLPLLVSRIDNDREPDILGNSTFVWRNA